MSQSLETKLISILFKIQGYSISNINIDEVRNRKVIVIALDETSNVQSSSCLYHHAIYDSTIQEILPEIFIKIVAKCPRCLL